MNIKIYSYTDSHEILATFHLKKYTRNNDGFCTIINNNYVIFYDKKISSQNRLTFTIAHEIGHIVLGHLKYDNIACLNCNKGESNALNQLEAAANIFASRILSPSCVLWGIKIHTISEIQNLCNLSFKASEIRKKRLDILYEREKKWIKNYGYSQFLLDKREQQVYIQFKEFIESYNLKKKST